MVDTKNYWDCPICSTRTYNPSDIMFGYCGNCHAYTGRCAIGVCTETPTKVFGNVAACAGHSRELDQAYSSGRFDN